MINAICKLEKRALGKTILLIKFHLFILIIKVTTAILVKGDSISKQTWLKAKYETVCTPLQKFFLALNLIDGFCWYFPISVLTVWVWYNIDFQ